MASNNHATTSNLPLSAATNNTFSPLCKRKVRQTGKEIDPGNASTYLGNVTTSCDYQSTEHAAWFMYIILCVNISTARHQQLQRAQAAGFRRVVHGLVITLHTIYNTVTNHTTHYTHREQLLVSAMSQKLDTKHSGGLLHMFAWQRCKRCTCPANKSSHPCNLPVPQSPTMAAQNGYAVNNSNTTNKCTSPIYICSLEKQRNPCMHIHVHSRRLRGDHSRVHQ
jgi:hypothetical protein